MRRRRLSAILCSEALVILIGSGYALTMLGLLSVHVETDTWLALVGGRTVAHSGLPADDLLTAWTHEVRWVDQQWLGQLAFYGLALLGGLKLVLLAHVAIASAAFGLALTAARRRGGSQRMVARVGILALLPVLAVSTTARTQSFGYLLFVAVLWLATADSGRPSRRALWIVPLLVVWANVHGSVLLGAALVVLSGAIFVVGGMRTGGDGGRDRIRHGGMLLAIGLISPLMSPYALSLGAYYGDTFFNSEFSKLVPEWMSPKPSAVTVPFYLLGGLALWLIGRSGARLNTFERAVLLVTLAAGLSAIRNIIWLALAATMLLPVAIERASRSQPRRKVPVWFEVGLSSAALLAVLAVAIVIAAGAARGYEDRYPPRVADAVWEAARQDPSSSIFADEAYGDWLLWRHPSLAGRVLFDARFELLSKRQLHDILIFHRQAGPRWREVVGDARILILDRARRPLPELPSAAEVLLREGRFRRLTRVGDVVVLTRSAAGGRQP